MSAAWPGSSEGSNSDSDGGAGSSLLRDAEEVARAALTGDALAAGPGTLSTRARECMSASTSIATCTAQSATGSTARAVLPLHLPRSLAPAAAAQPTCHLMLGTVHDQFTFMSGCSVTPIPSRGIYSRFQLYNQAPGVLSVLSVAVGAVPNSVKIDRVREPESSAGASSPDSP